MHSHKTKKLIKTALSIAIIAGAAGAATGTYAWYSYQKDVDAQFSGTTIRADKEIQIGLRNPTKLKRINEEGQEEFFIDEYPLGQVVESQVSMNGDSQWVYWIRGNYVSEILQKFQEYIQSAQNELHPITAGKYKTGDIADGSTLGSWTGFMKTPSHREEERVTTGAVTDYSDYFYLPLVFRVLSNELDPQGNEQYVDGEEIFLSKFSAVDETVEKIEKKLEDEDREPTDEEEAQLSADLSQAIRVKTDYPAENDEEHNYNFIFNPNYQDPVNEYQYLDVGGVLNLQPDIYFDYELDTKKQIAYGQFEGDVVWKSEKTETPPTLAYADCTTFDANNFEDGYEIDFGEDKTKPSTCQTKRSQVNAAHDAGKGIIKTGEDKYAFLDLSIYLEGWDENIVNYTAGRTFSVDLEFSIK